MTDYVQWSFRELRKADVTRLREVRKEHQPTARYSIYLSASFWSVCLFRCASYFFTRQNYLIARIFWNVNLFLTGADVSPHCKIGPGLVFLHTNSIIVSGYAGSNFTVLGQGGMGYAASDKDIGAGVGLPIIGDDVCLPFRTVILGPVRIGHRALIPAGIVWCKNLADNAELEAPAVRILESTKTQD